MPGGSESSIFFHIARTVVRRAERKVSDLLKKEKINPHTISYLNRLSDALFVWSRWILTVTNIEEELWNPNLDK